MNKNTLTKIIEKYQARTPLGERDYIGASIIGSECLRQIWYELNQEVGEDVPAKTKRTWEIGRRLEGLVLDWLEEARITIDILPPLSSERVNVLKGHVDAVWLVEGKPKAIIEIKTAKDASFKVFIKKGLKVWNPQYYAQVQAYMGMSGINSAYILVLNKDNSDLFDELVLFDEEFYRQLEDKALLVANSIVAPPRINGSPLFYKCKMCKFSKVCHTSI